ncbi:MAG: methyltransferase domain-containing protein [Verrucomicrobia bacterium]|nr:methyltransferase domain-containing protein [Verrucomicrobiota bacterium]
MEPTAKPTPLYRSETSKHRTEILPFCQGYGIDIGFGGDPINASAIRMDLPSPYAYTGDNPVQLGGDCRHLKWIADNSLDYAYSSHVLEDFDRTETEAVLREWIRVVRPGGLVVLLLPDQVRYVEDCRKRGEVSADGIVGNPHHSIADFSMRYVLEVAARIGGVEKHHAIDQLGAYSFLLVLKKSAPTVAVANLDAALEKAWADRDALKLQLREKERELARAGFASALLNLGRRIKRRLGR